MLNKRNIDEYISIAIDELKNSKNSKIVKNGKINSTFSAQISTFAIAISMGSVLSAIAFFSDNGSSTVERKELMKILLNVISKGDELKEIIDVQKKEYELLELAREINCEPDNMESSSIYKYDVRKIKFKKIVLEASTAIKLAMNYFIIEKNLEDNHGK